MKICGFADTFLPTVGGAQTVLDNLATQLTLHGDRFSVLAPWVRGKDNRLQTCYSVRRYAKPFSKRYGIKQLLIPLAWRYFRSPFEILHCHSTYPCAYIAKTFKRATNVPFVVRPYGGDILPDSRVCKNPLLLARVKSTLRAADAVIAQGEFLRDTILKLGVSENRVHVINNGVDLKLFSTWSPFQHPRPYLLGLGNLVYRKGFDLLIRAYARATTHDVDLIIAGDGIERRTLEKLARELGVASRVRFVGNVQGQTKVDLYRSAECLICPSRSEPFSNVILESLASGLPVIASAVGGNKEQIRHGQHGILVPNEDVPALTDAISGILREPQLLNRLRSDIPAFIQRFDWPLVALQYRQIYESILGVTTISLRQESPSVRTRLGTLSKVHHRTGT